LTRARIVPGHHSSTGGFFEDNKKGAGYGALFASKRDVAESGKLSVGNVHDDPARRRDLLKQGYG
jgi:hypothetical protein